jgi:hypothetical protein
MEQNLGTSSVASLAPVRRSPFGRPVPVLYLFARVDAVHRGTTAHRIWVRIQTSCLVAISRTYHRLLQAQVARFCQGKPAVGR